MTVIAREDVVLQVPLSFLEQSRAYITFAKEREGQPDYSAGLNARPFFRAPKVSAFTFEKLAACFAGAAPALPADLAALMELARGASCLGMDDLLAAVCSAVDPLVRAQAPAALSAMLGLDSPRRSGDDCLGPLEIREAALAIAGRSAEPETSAKLAELGGAAAPPPPVNLTDLAAWGCEGLLKRAFASQPPRERCAALAKLLEKRDLSALAWLLRRETSQDVTGDFFRGQLTLAFLANDFPAMACLLAQGRGVNYSQYKNMESLLLAGSRPGHCQAMNWLLSRVTFVRRELVDCLFMPAVQAHEFAFASAVAGRLRLVPQDLNENHVDQLLRCRDLTALKYLVGRLGAPGLRLRFGRDVQNFFLDALTCADLETAVWLMETFALSGGALRLGRDMCEQANVLAPAHNAAIRAWLDDSLKIESHRLAVLRRSRPAAARAER